MVKIGIDASGGDFGYETIVQGAYEACQLEPSIHVVLYADEDRIQAMPQGNNIIASRLSIEHFPHPSGQLMAAFEDLAQGKIQAIVTARKSRELMGAARDYRLPGVPRPGLLAPCPTRNEGGFGYILDVGATARVNDPAVFQAWAAVGCLFLKTYLGIPQPRLGLTNIATESAYRELMVIHDAIKDCEGFIGFVEPKQFFAGEADLWLTEGFVGNLLIKLLEEAAASFMTGALLACSDLPEAASRIKQLIKDAISYDAHLISPFLGVIGWVFRVHGAARAEQIARAIIYASRRFPIAKPIFA